MEDPAIQEATASERLTLEEEYENQESWRSSHDKLTFILCQPAIWPSESSDKRHVTAGEVDTPQKMIGDINFFLYPYEADDDGQDENVPDTGARPSDLCVGEVDIMIAGSKDRGRGLGKAAVSAFLYYILQNLAGILGEYQAGAESSGDRAPARALQLKALMVKIKATNSSSIALFKRLGFEQEGDVNYFGEVKLTLEDLDSLTGCAPESYAEIVYSRPEEEK